LEDEQTKGAPGGVLDNEVSCHGQTHGGGDSAATMIAVASPARQWIVDPIACFPRGTMNDWWLGPVGLRHEAR
jgi:hypothetical protein